MSSYDRGVGEAGDEFSIFVPPELEAGAYANRLSVWHSEHEFTLDFCTSLASEEDLIVHYRVVARIKLPVTLILETLRQLSDAMTRYEDPFGEIGGSGER